MNAQVSEMFKNPSMESFKDKVFTQSLHMGRVMRTVSSVHQF